MSWKVINTLLNKSQAAVYLSSQVTVQGPKLWGMDDAG